MLMSVLALASPGLSTRAGVGGDHGGGTGDIASFSRSMSRYSYPHSIDNGAGERLTFLRRVPGPRGERVEVENIVQPGSGPPMHVHHHQDEALTVVAGRVGYERPGEQAKFAGPGETVTFTAGEAHRFWNAGTDELRCT